MNKRTKKKKETMDKLRANTEFSINCMDFKSEKERKQWVKFMTYKA
jgi:hypothetical protein